jgi:hypothetical protein
MLVKINSTNTGLIATDSTLKSIFITRNGVNTYFTIETDNTIEISLYTIEDVSELNFQIDSKASVLLDSLLKTIRVTAEDGTQTLYTYTLTTAVPYAGLFPLINSIQANSIDALVGVPSKEVHGAYYVNVSDLIVESDIANVSFTGDVFVEYQDLSTLNINIPADLATSLQSTGFVYYIVGWGDGIGGNGWGAHPDLNNEYIFYRTIADATQFDTTVISTINLSKLNKVYGLVAPETIVFLDSILSADNFNTVMTAQYQTFVDVATLRLALDGLSQTWEVFDNSNIDSYPKDIEINEAIALNNARSLELFTLEDLYALNVTVATQLKGSTVSVTYPYILQYCDEIISGDDGYTPPYTATTLTSMKSEVLVEAIKLFTDVKFWLSETGLGFQNTKFIYDRFKFVSDNFELFDFMISKASVDRIVTALDDLISYYYLYGASNGTTLLPDTYVLLADFATILPSAKNNTLVI